TIAAMQEVRAVLLPLVEGGALAADDRALLAAFANHARRHLIAENAIIMPLARARLSDDDLRTLRAEMRRRRAWTEPRETP
ncbi:MAG: hypothetical protein GWO02_15015, partial [Gammaproteobacteria bacterium]|nr:hypothetical protein [Gammaproteobacteria bacterium]